ncbi:hypothetical protein BX600DRAFT_452094 [Xylariales sp. PMI_506]|nr:hypothetical protein BX600DRAFT_452094 [Xylariales sp. PMI_506]
MRATELSASRRPNGRLVACIPCRARKVACDHARPACGRCRRRQDAGAGCAYPDVAAPADLTTETMPDFGETFTQASHLEAYRPSPANMASPQGYLGATSHLAVLEEAEHHLPSMSGLSMEPTEALSRLARPQQRILFSALPPPLKETCRTVLRCLPEHIHEALLNHDSLGQPCSWRDVAIWRMVPWLQDTLLQLRTQGDVALDPIAEMLCNNTAVPMWDDFSTLDEWLDQFSTSTLRWESLGLLWAHMERVSDLLDALRNRRLEWVKTGPEAFQRARLCLRNCIDLARYFTDGNMLLLDLCRRRTSLESIFHGSARMSTCGSRADTVALLTFLGVHVQKQDDWVAYTPTLASEYKRRLFAQIFNNDKLGVMYTGRPPMLSRRYCSVPLPLDIQDEDFIGDAETLSRAAASLDEHGWNTQGAIYPSTIIRARAMIAYIRDEIFDIALSMNITVTIDQLLDIKARQMANKTLLPPQVIYSPSDLTDPSLDIRILYVKIVMQLEHLQNLFLVERMLVLRGHLDEGDVLVTSYSMVALTLVCWTQRERFSHNSMRRQFEWLLMAYGAPAGGVLCLELLRPTFSGVHPKDSSVSRSTIVQQLSLLVAFLDWGTPSGSHGNLCANCSSVIQRVLDHHLNTPDPGTAGLDMLGWNFAHQPSFNFDLLNTFNWLSN